MTILTAILEHKRAEVALQRLAEPDDLVRARAARATPPLDFVAALRGSLARPALIAEIKRRSPSRGAIAPHLDPRKLAQLYRDGGAAAISVLTDEHFFGGSLADLSLVREEAPGVPLLRKDFVIDPYQLYQARAAGADAVLLIVAALEPAQLRDLHALVISLGMTALIETHSEDELSVALSCRPRLVGINHRDLRDFTIDLGLSERLAARIPPEICVVAESGIRGPQELARLAALRRPNGGRGVDAVLVGEALVTAPDPSAAVRLLAGRERRETIGSMP